MKNMLQARITLVALFLSGLMVLLQGCSGGGSAPPPGTVSFNPSAVSPVLCSIDTNSTPAPNPLSCPLGEVLVGGHVSFDRVPHGVGSGLDYNPVSISTDPVRGATIQAVYTGGVRSTVTDATGDYSLCVPENTNMVIRARAEMLRTGGQPSWDFTVVDNTSSKALYAIETSSFNSGSVTIPDKDLHADDNWTGAEYGPNYAAGPFAILDSVYNAFQKVVAECTGARFPPLKINWSVDNVPASGDPASGQITTSLFDGTEIYILGAEDIDTDEYDEHVVIHEWGHYFEEYFSRADSIGGSHSGGDVLDVRVAFSEGFGNAFSAMVTNSPDYNDSAGNNQAFGFDLNIESNSCSNAGWYNECSAQSILYDLYDSANDDATSLDFGPIFDVLTDEHRNTSAVTSIFSFVHELKQNNSGSVTAINNLVSGQRIDTIGDIYGDSQITNNPGLVDKLPLHASISAGQTINVCSTAEHQSYNGLGVSRFLRFNAAAGQSFQISATRTSGLNPADPDIELHFKGQTTIADSIDVNSEVMRVTLGQAGVYVIDVYEFANLSASPQTTCFDVALTSI